MGDGRPKVRWLPGQGKPPHTFGGERICHGTPGGAPKLTVIAVVLILVNRSALVGQRSQRRIWHRKKNADHAGSVRGQAREDGQERGHSTEAYPHVLDDQQHQHKPLQLEDALLGAEGLQD